MWRPWLAPAAVIALVLIGFGMIGLAIDAALTGWPRWLAP